MPLLLTVLLSALLNAGGFVGEAKTIGFAAARENCSNGIDDDGDGLIDLRDPDCSCRPRPLPTGRELIINGGFEELADRSACAGCVSLFSSDNCPVGWRQESVNLHTPCYTSANPSVNIGYINGANGNYQGVGGYGRANENQRQQEEYLSTHLVNALERGGAYRFAANFALPVAELDGINEAPTHRIAILGSRSGTALQRSPDRCYSDDAEWELLATIDIKKSPRPAFVNYSTSFIARDRFRYLAIASDCCQDGEDTRAENLTYWAVDDISLKAADLDPIEADITVLPRDCDQDVRFCAETPSGVWDYQWYQDSTAVVGATSQCLSVPIDSVPGRTFSVWITSSDNCRVVSLTLPAIPNCGPQVEDCTNGLDDDGDGLIDEADEDCDCLNTDLGLQISASPAVIALGESSRLQLTTAVPSPRISWSPAEGLSCTDCPSPIVQPVRSTVYTASVTDAESGCSERDSIRITLLPGRALYQPNVFSPNADGINDVWRAFPSPAVEDLRDLQVFDRWGNLVYDSPTAEAWDGRERPAGYYVYQLLVRFIDGHEERVRGNIMLVR